MANGELRGERLQIMLTGEELTVLDDFRYRKRMPSRAAAIRELLKRGYQSVDSPKRIGHGIGMARAEPPSLNEVETELHRPGMILALEPKVRSEKSAVHLEEDVLITEKGPEFLTNGCRVLRVIT